MNTATILLAFCALAVASALGADMHEKLHADIQKCIADTGADPTVLEKLHAGEDVVFDDNIKCFSACMLKTHKLMKEDGTVDPELGKADIPSDTPNRDKIVAAIDACASEKGANECETAHAISMCMHKTLKGTISGLE